MGAGPARALALVPVLAALAPAVACAPPTLTSRCQRAEDCPSGYACETRSGTCRLSLLDAAALEAGLISDAGREAGAEGGLADASAEDRPLPDSGALDATGEDLRALDGASADQAATDAAAEDTSAGDGTPTDACAVDQGAPPVALDLELRTAVDASVDLELLGADPQSQPLSYRLLQAPARGSLGVAAGELFGGAALTYQPGSAQRGFDSFTYVVRAGCRESAPATVRIAIVDGDWWDARWHQRLLLAFDNRGRAEALLDVPVPLVLRDARLDLGLLAADAADLRVVAADGQPLAHEVEQWAPASRGVVWIRVPALQASALRNLAWLYFGAPGAGSTALPTAVWDTSYVGVWHLAGSAGRALQDSTAHALHLTQRDAALGFQTPGLIGDAVSFDGHGEPLAVPDQALLDLTGSMTLEGLALPTWVTDTNVHYLIKKDESYYLEMSGDGTYCGPGATVCIAGNGVDCAAPLARHTTALPELDRWLHVAATFDGSLGILQVYLDGQPLAPKTTAAAAIVPSIHELLLGRDFFGRIDELRVENRARSAAWIDAQAAAQRDGLVHYGPLPWSARGQSLASSGPTALDLQGQLDAGAYSQWIAVVGLATGNVASSVSGLGLTWTRLLRQCSAIGGRTLELWQAEGYAEGDQLLVTPDSGGAVRGVVGLVQVIGAHLPHGAAPTVAANALGQGAAATCAGGATVSSDLVFQLSSEARASQALLAVLADGAVTPQVAARSMVVGSWNDSSGQPPLQLWLFDVSVPPGTPLAVAGTAGASGNWIVGAAVHRP